MLVSPRKMALNSLRALANCSTTPYCMRLNITWLFTNTQSSDMISLLIGKVSVLFESITATNY